ncbi:MAG TPA: Cof-type HAD-IIB family hydrolase [bacterium]|nr:Cof-type HAD-IIB family hydrolase [bacterium]
MIYGLLVADIDGTLVGEDKVVPPGVAAAVRAARDRGVRVCLATGRMWDAARPFAEAIEADSPAILYNGALVYDFAADRALWAHRLPLEVAARLLPVLRRFPQTSPLVFVRGRVYAERQTPFVDVYARRDRLTVEIATPFERVMSEDPVKLLIVGRHEDLLELRRAIDAAAGPAVSQVFSQSDYLEVLPSGVSKGAALPVLARAVGVPLSRTVAVGDNHNDLTMLQAAGLGVAVADAPPEVLAAAKATCPPPGQEGVRVVIERYFLDPGRTRAGETI